MKLFRPIVAYRRLVDQVAVDDAIIAEQQEVFDSGAIPVVHYPNTSLSLD